MSCSGCLALFQINWLPPVDLTMKSLWWCYSDVTHSTTSHCHSFADGFVQLSRSNRSSREKFVCLRVPSLLDETREHLRCPNSSPGRRWLRPVKWCINMEMTQWTLRPPPPGLPSHLPPSCPVASGRCCSGRNAAERDLEWGQEFSLQNLRLYQWKAKSGKRN